jgi:two-component sensor histidine kinase
MGLIHEKLYQNESLSDIDFGQYISELVGVIVRSHNKTEDDIKITLDSVPIKLPIKKAVPCGLIINEIVTNSLKHAFPEGHKDPEIRIKMSRENSRATIAISDNGVGLSAPFEELETNSLGTLLIKTLTSQLNADLSVETDEGTKYIFSFDLVKD